MAFQFDVVVSGISGRFPECNDIDTFRKKLYIGDSNDFITNNDKKWANGFKLHRYNDKQPIPQATGKYTTDHDFDYRAFKFNQSFAKSTIGISHKILEPSFEAIVDAGINPYSLSGSNVGVFMSSAIAEADNQILVKDTGYVFVLGTAKTMAPNRISYSLNLTGPSYSTVCDPLGDFEVLKMAKNLISDGTIEAAIVIAANHLHYPTYSYLYSILDFLTPEDFCRSFDKNAKGFVRSESAVALYLQREQDAKRIYGKVTFCDTIYNGLQSSTLLGYDEEYLKNSLRTIYERNSGDSIAKNLSFVELTGCAVKQLEKVESNAVSEVLCQGRKNPLLVGSIKSLLGHTEASSPFLSLLKIIFALDSQTIAPNLNYSEPNNDIRAFHEKKLQVVDKTTELSGNMAAVNIIGLFGSLNHVVLQKNPTDPKTGLVENKSLPRLLLLSGRTEKGVKKVLIKITLKSHNLEAIALANDVFSTDIPFHIYRGFTILPKTNKTTLVVEERRNAHRPVCFVFSGMGSQWNGMGKQLLNLPVFAEAIKRCDAVLKPKSIDIYEVLQSDNPDLFNDITISFVSIISMQIALVEILKTLNIKPDIILGHSVGENACAYADGCLTLEQAVEVSYARGIASKSVKTIEGMMAAIGKGYNEIKHSLPKCIEVACHNAANSCTISGPAEDVDTYVTELKKQGIFAKSVNVANIAFHSKYIIPVAPYLREALQKTIPQPQKRSPRWISSSIPEENWNQPLAETCSAEYLTNNLLNPVLFEEASKHIPNDSIVIEIAPHGLLQAILRKALPTTCTNVSLTRRSTKQDNMNYFLSSIGQLYIAGCEPTVNNLYPPVEYPVPRGTPSISPYCTWYHGDCDTIKPFLIDKKPVPLSRENIPVRVNENSEFNFLKDHRINEQMIIPPSFYLYLVWNMLSVHENVNLDNFPVLFEKIKVQKNVKILTTSPQLVNILIQGSGSFEVLTKSKWNKDAAKVVLTGQIKFIRDDVKVFPNYLPMDKLNFSFGSDDINKILSDTGFQLGKCFQLLRNVKLMNSESFANIEWNGNWVAFLDAIMKFQMFPHLRQSKLCHLHSARRMMIIPSKINSLPIGSNVFCYKNESIRTFQCNGVEMNDVKWKLSHPPQTKESSTALKIRKMKFVSHDNPSCQSPEEFVEFCIQMVMENFETTSDVSSRLIIFHNSDKLKECTQNSNSINGLPKIKINYCPLETLAPRQASPENTYFIITEDKMDLVADTPPTPNTFVLLIASKFNPAVEIPSEFTKILTQNISGKIYCFLKKNLDYIPQILVEENNVNQNLMSNKKHSSNTKVIILPELDSSSLTLMFSKKKSSDLRYLILSNKYKANDDNYKLSVMLKAVCDLPVSLLKNGDWGSYRFLPTINVNCAGEGNFVYHGITKINLESICVKYFRTESFQTQSSEELSFLEKKTFAVEFSGVNESGKRVMGLTSVNFGERISKIDPLLTWPIPDEWTMAQAATISSVYTHVYYVMEIIERSTHMPTPTIVIIMDTKNVNAELCISICLRKKFTLYVVVPDKNAVSRLKTMFPAPNELNILTTRSNDFDVSLLLETEGRGANILVNYSPGFKNVICSLNCISQFALFIETVETNVNDEYEFGMFPFLKCCSFYVIPNKIRHLLDLPAEQKMTLHRKLEQGIQTGFVKYFPEQPTTAKIQHNNEHGINDSLPGDNLKRFETFENGSEPPHKSLKFGSNRSYIIFEGKRGDSWMKIVQWLKGEGAMTFTVVLENFSANSRISSQMNRLLVNKKMTISFKSLSTINSVEDANQLMDETNKIASLDSVFFISLKSVSNKIRYMDVASKKFKQTIKFISLFSGGVEEMESRQSRGDPAFVLHGEHFPKDISQTFVEFNKILDNYYPADDSSVLYQIVQETSSSDKFFALEQYLPKNIDDLERIGRRMTREIKFEEMTSRCLNLKECQGVLPIFVVPGLQALELKSLFYSLMYPVFCASLTDDGSSISNTASKLFENLKSIQPLGPVTLIGETWNAAVAMKLSSLVKKSGREFKLFLLEGNPVEWKETINELNLTNCQEFEDILTRIYGEKLKECFPFWDEVTNTKKHEFNGRDFTYNRDLNIAHVRRCLNLLRQLLVNAKEYTVDGSMVESTVLFTKHVSQNISLVLSDSSDIVYISENDYDSFIRSPMVKKVINKNAKFAWRYS